MQLLQIQSDEGVVLSVFEDGGITEPRFQRYSNEVMFFIPASFSADFRATMSKHLPMEEVWTMLSLWCLDVINRDGSN